jgi:AmmeMemoRadiSam system protein B
MHGTVREPDLRGLDVRRRAVLVIERGRSGLVLDAGRAVEELVEEAAGQARVGERAGAPIFSLEADTTETRLVFSTAPQPLAGAAVRPAAVAGQFYPGDAAALNRMVTEMLGDERGAESWPAAMVPHAGLRFSGRLAAAVLRRLAIPRTVIVLGPKHTPLGMEWAVAPHERWALPGASVASDPALARALAEAIPGLTLDAAAHQREHAIEVELPFLARLAPEARVVGIAIGEGDLASCRRFAEGLAEVLRRREDRPLLLISSDMNHFATDAETRRLDEMALTALEGLDPEEVYRTVRGHHISMCGVLPAVIVLETLRRLGGLSRAERVGYATSADVTGETGRVVGYAGMLFR